MIKKTHTKNDEFEYFDKYSLMSKVAIPAYQSNAFHNGLNLSQHSSHALLD